MLDVPQLLCNALCWARPLPKLIKHESWVQDVPQLLCITLVADCIRLKQLLGKRRSQHAVYL